MDYKCIFTDIKEILRFKLYCMYIINAVSLIRTFHLFEQNFEPMNQRGSDKRGCTVYILHTLSDILNFKNATKHGVSKRLCIIVYNTSL